MVHVQGQVLNLTSAWWMQRTEHIVPNALLAVPDPNVSIMRRCTVFPVEFVVRGFMTGARTVPVGLPACLSSDARNVQPCIPGPIGALHAGRCLNPQRPACCDALLQ